MTARFHLAFAVHDLDIAREFYVDKLGCRDGRCSDDWIDIDFFGNQLSLHLDRAPRAPSARGTVDGHGVPIPHFGVIVSLDRWEALRDRLRAQAIVISGESSRRFAGTPGEQASLFITDPSGNAIEFKGFADETKIFAAF